MILFYGAGLLMQGDKNTRSTGQGIPLPTLMDSVTAYDPVFLWECPGSPIGAMTSEDFLEGPQQKYIFVGCRQECSVPMCAATERIIRGSDGASGRKQSGYSEYLIS